MPFLTDSMTSSSPLDIPLCIQLYIEVILVDAVYLIHVYIILYKYYLLLFIVLSV